MTKYLISILTILLLLPTSVWAGDKIKKTKKTHDATIFTPEPDKCPAKVHDTKLLENHWTSNSFKQKTRTHGNGEGIDVSHYQGHIDWASLAATGQISYAFVKATESNYFIDNYYHYNISEGRKYGITMGCYHFFRANVSMEEQFKHMISVVKAEDLDVIPIIDVENANGVGVETFAARLRSFMAMVEEYYGKPPILYTYVNFYNKYIAYHGFDRYPLMIAFYQDHQPRVVDGNNYIMWQYTCHGQLEGIRGNVDRSRFTNGFTINDILY